MTYDPRRDDLMFQAAQSDGKGGFVPVTARDMGTANVISHIDGRDFPPPEAEWPSPTPEMLDDPKFNAIWGVIKSWDINVPSQYSGYCGATGNHARAILDALPVVTPDPRDALIAELCEALEYAKADLEAARILIETGFTNTGEVAYGIRQTLERVSAALRRARGLA